MKKTETRYLTREDATGFLNNMMWFAGMGRIIVRRQHDLYKITATPAAWSHWVNSKTS